MARRRRGLFAREGAKVALTDLRIEMSRRIAAELEAEGGQALPDQCNVSGERQAR